MATTTPSPSPPLPLRQPRRLAISAAVVLDVRPLFRDEVVWTSLDPERTTGAVTMDRVAAAPLILYDAHYGWTDPTRRQLADRAQAAGVRLEPVIEVENVESALALAARGVGDTIASRAVTTHPSFPAELRTAPFADPLYDTIALIKRTDSTLSPGTTELARLATQMLAEREAVVLLPRAGIG